MISTGRNSDQYMHRFSDGMRERVKAAATANGRSMTAEINARIEASFDAQRAIHPEIARLLDQHVEAEVAARLRAIASSTRGGEEA